VDMMDADAPIPFVRDKKYLDFNPDHVKMTHVDPNDPDDKTTYFIHMYKALDQEDIEVFMETLVEFKVAMENKTIWNNKANQTANAARLFTKFALSC